MTEYYHYLMQLTQDERQRLTAVREDLSKRFGFEFSINKTIKYLINEYQINDKEEKENER